MGDVITWTAMVNGHANSGQIELARVFGLMPERNVVSWSTMITTFAQVGMFQKVSDVFNEMQVAGIRVYVKRNWMESWAPH